VRRRLGNNDVILLANIARAYAGAGDFAKATAFARTAYEIAPANPMVTHIYGQIMQKAGTRPKAAKELLQKAALLMPDNRLVANELRQAELAYRKSAKRQ
jgi:predicted Zn-dependent protease